MTAPIVIKVGGSFFTELQTRDQDPATNLEGKNIKEANNGPMQLLNTLATLQAHKQAVVLVHGGGEQVLKRLEAFGMRSIRKNGLRMTPHEHMPLVCGVLAGELNKQLVATAAKYDVNAVGISLADSNLANCHAKSADLGVVGEPIAESPELLNALFTANIIPIVASIGKDKKGQLYNVNADHAAICLAGLLKTKLYFFADVPGVLDEKKQVIAEICKGDFDLLVDKGVITDGMVVKVEAALHAANQIQYPVTIASWENSYALLVKQEQCGTQILPELIKRPNVKEEILRAQNKT